MKIPTYEEICLETHRKENIQDLFSKKRFGQVPYYITIDSVDPRHLKEAIRNVTEVLLALEKNLFFPYPVYLVGNISTEETHLPVVQNLNLLPQHFFNKIRRLKNKETKLLTKTTMLSAKVRNEDITKKLEEFKSIMGPQKKLFYLSKEISFYQKIFEGMEKSIESAKANDKGSN